MSAHIQLALERRALLKYILQVRVCWGAARQGPRFPRRIC